MMIDERDCKTPDLVGRKFAVIRMSSASRERGGQLPHAQRQAMAARGWLTPDVVVVESYESGAIDWRSRALGKVLLGCKRGDVLYASEMRAYGRGVGLMLDIVAFADKVGVRLYCADMGGDHLSFDTSSSLLRNGLTALIDHSERQKARERTKLHISSLVGVDGLVGRWGRPKGSKNKSGRKGAGDIDRAKRLLDSGEKRKDVAKLLGISTESLRTLLRGVV